MVRNKIWRHVISDERWLHLHTLEEITQVNKQLRAETLPICYEKPYELNIWDETPADWVKSVEEVIDGLSAKSGPPGSSPIHHLSGLELNLEAADPEGYQIYLCFYLMKDHEKMMDITDNRKHERVVIASPDMDWTDAKAVRAACDEAATQLESNRRQHIEEVEEEALDNEDQGPREYLKDLWSKDYPAHYRAAVDALYALVSVCSHLTNVAVLDDSEEACVGI